MDGMSLRTRPSSVADSHHLDQFSWSDDEYSTNTELSDSVQPRPASRNSKVTQPQTTPISYDGAISHQVAHHLMMTDQVKFPHLSSQKLTAQLTTASLRLRLRFRTNLISLKSSQLQRHSRCIREPPLKARHLSYRTLCQEIAALVSLLLPKRSG